ncbi:hypothetical protein EJB05_01626, partial [Eragrostis curvula]
MASPSPSPSPSGSSRRRLSELLDQQQEPFSLDLYLLEKGCSSAFLDAVVLDGGGGGACSTCWPRSGSTGRMMVRSPAARRKDSCASGLLRHLLCKILGANMTAAATATAKKRQQQLPGIDRRRVHGEKQRTSGDVQSSVLTHRATEASTVKAEEEEVEDDDDVSKRLSPVSVLEQSTLEDSPPPHEQKALVLFMELQQTAYSPTLLDLLANAKASSRSNRSKKSSTKTSKAARKKKHAHLKDDTLFEEALAKVTDTIATETAGSAKRWPWDVQPERGDVGTDIAVAVLDAMVEETAAELMPMDGP